MKKKRLHTKKGSPYPGKRFLIQIIWMLVFLANAHAQAESSLEQAIREIGPKVNLNKTVFINEGSGISFVPTLGDSGATAIVEENGYGDLWCLHIPGKGMNSTILSPNMGK